MSAPAMAPSRSDIHPAARSSWRKTLGRALFWLVILLIIFYTLFPFYWAVVTSLKPRAELFATPVALYPVNPTLEHYAVALSAPFFRQGLLNSVIVSLTTVILALIIGSVTAYALGRLHFRGRNLVLYTTLALTTFPQIAILPSLFTMVRNPCVIFGGDCPQASVYNTYWALIIPYLTFTLPFTVWVLSNFFKTLPAELEQAAYVDGASPLQTFYMVLLPLSMPGLVTTGLLAFISAWNEFLFALTFTIDYRARTVPVAIATFSGGPGSFEIPWGDIMAASVVVTVPLIVLVLIFQRRILAGLTAGAVKG